MNECHMDFMSNENHDMAITMSSSRADPVLCTGIEYSTGLIGGISIFKSVPLPWQEVFKYLNQCNCTAIITGQSCVV